MAAVKLENIQAVERSSFTQFQVIAKVPFSKSGKDTLHLTCDSASACVRWLKLFSHLIPDAMNGTGFTPLSADARPATDHYGEICLLPHILHFPPPPFPKYLLRRLPPAAHFICRLSLLDFCG